jgi:DNA/RNA endonuclease G (NUC1)
VVVPDAYFKSVLAETKRGALKIWTFAIPNAATDKPPASFLVPTVEVERRAGLTLWDRLTPTASAKLKATKGTMWGAPAKRKTSTKKAPAKKTPAKKTSAKRRAR